MRKFGGAAALAVGLTMSMAPVIAASPAPADDRPATVVKASAADQERGKKCATRKEYKRIDAKGKNASTLRQVRKIIGYNGKRHTISHAEGHKWEIRKYRYCGSGTLHVYVNYRDNRAYHKAV
ncbi:hypothetical protein [Solicola gregarius]|uniref:Secreted protein n=1 Tax=Solicola gregarius TaxID=2908642 RepID=A0AA46TGF6_9ACTN|nr:hypothetical protein [Solicola gregarius]UYM04728.1 hypothetical protein L0C25_19650 [Solicola gregarius]